MTTADLVATIDRYQRDCWMMFAADEEMGQVPGWYDPTVVNYWMVLPAERVATDWSHLPMDGSCTTCHRDLAEHGWGTGLDGCENLADWQAWDDGEVLS